jgi:hypothetical protein
MSLKITNKLTEKQRSILVKLEYIGTWDLTVDQATKVIDELFAERKYTYAEIMGTAGDYYDYPEQHDYYTNAGD